MQLGRQKRSNGRTERLLTHWLGDRAMHYRIGGKLVRSEFAAKPPSQASAHLLAYLNSRDPVRRAVDYGCGKLRYASALAAMAKSFTLVDSELQLDRQQAIDGDYTTVRKLAAERWPNARIESVAEFEGDGCPLFDFVLCANVLSAIPSKFTRNRALQAIRRRLDKEGVLLVVNQHTNSYYSQVARRDGVKRHLDGWLVPKGNSASYYGILDKARTAEILTSEGFEVVNHWIKGQSNYALVRST